MDSHKAPSGQPAPPADRIVVRFDGSGAPSAVEELLKTLPANTTLVKDLDSMGRAVLQLPAGADVGKVLAELEARAGIVYAEPLFIDHSSG